MPHFNLQAFWLQIFKFLVYYFTCTRRILPGAIDGKTGQVYGQTIQFLFTLQKNMLKWL